VILVKIAGKNLIWSKNQWVGELLLEKISRECVNVYGSISTSYLFNSHRIQGKV